MAARTWFTVENCTMGPAMTRTDIAILNRGARILDDELPRNSSRAHMLTTLRMTYKPGMNARELAEAVSKILED